MFKVSILKTRPHSFKLGAESIMLFEGVNFSHIAISYKDPRLDIRYVVEARGGGIRLLSNKQFKKDNFIVSGSYYEVDIERLNHIHEYCYDQLAIDYGYMSLAGLAAMRIKQGIYNSMGIDRVANNPFRDGEYSQICVELAIRVMMLCKDMVLPSDIENYGLRGFNKLDLRHGIAMSQEKIDRINGVKKA